MLYGDVTMIPYNRGIEICSANVSHDEQLCIGLGRCCLDRISDLEASVLHRGV